ncbi:hypothetical protein MTR67_040155 [Solanum verrucosum]|uniref:Uncharacterized protein n=1 Tax=Solanum verrucosum TaxID=315347 RepID=A0AAF0UJA6_SOLVR|nr:hypothetical protein MTR67_040155 [Solanum verrucosum]
MIPQSVLHRPTLQNLNLLKANAERR